MYRLFLAQRYLRTRLVNLIAVGGVMFGVAVLIVVMSVMGGFREKVLTALRGNLADLTMTPIVAPHDRVPAFADVDQRIRRDPRVVATAPQLEQIVFYTYSAYGVRGLAFDGHAVQQMQAVGIDFDREKKVSDIATYLLAANETTQPFASERASQVFGGERYREGTVIVSRTFAEGFLALGSAFVEPKQLLEQDLGITFLDLGGMSREPAVDHGSPDGMGSPDDVGSPDGMGNPDGDGDGAPGDESGAPAGQRQLAVGVRTHNLVISAVYDAKDTSLDRTRLYMDIEELRRIARIRDEYHVIRVKLKDPNHSAAVQAHFQEAFPNFQTRVWQEYRADYLKAVNNEKVLLGIVLSFIVLLGGFIILATLTLTVVEKTRDIGVLGALGANRNGILSLFAGTAILIGLIGSGLGVLLGWLFTENVNGIKTFLETKMGIDIFPAEIYLFREIPTIWDWSEVLWIAGGSLLMALIAGLIPALRAARMDPVKALRYE